MLDKSSETKSWTALSKGWTLLCALTAVCCVFLFTALFTGSFWGIHVVALFMVFCGAMGIKSATSATAENQAGECVFGAILMTTALLWWTIDIKWPLYISMIIVLIGITSVANSDEEV